MHSVTCRILSPDLPVLLVNMPKHGVFSAKPGTNESQWSTGDVGQPNAYRSRLGSREHVASLQERILSLETFIRDGMTQNPAQQEASEVQESPVQQTQLFSGSDT